ncbi:NEK protein kinase [Spizellomyces punctatus DAOM BR117]|uniref:non-specific serine/threonine protein kinase n=1 Tax=Spizellomyces punctatus (strain DAOM BR117) TaxID=645134 RepID=A0A0L0HHR0_SPIPD|nr:NEK protein kinase [Spizellomyces punctatus DAOM BR117]KND01006.1 NEK protein kinase [Spizellomyces punctatus DAOM BR117]|eukprot:XP_016609045.1 NEK protein kinase [Spizellomyces punctatus DAOM BR117]
MEYNPNKYEPLNLIGRGSFGVIRKVRRRSDGKIYARKEIDYKRMSEREKKQLVAEVNILRELRHPHIVRYYERDVDRDNCLMYIYMEYCEGGDLAEVIRRYKKRGKRFAEQTIWKYLAQLLLALHECHCPGSGKSGVRPTVLHRDLKPDNVFLDGRDDVKLGDFGLSRLMDGSEFARTYVGTPFYMSPELISESSYNEKSDVWALGCLIYELCTLDPPFQAKTQSQLAMKIQQGAVAPLPPQYSQELFYIIKAMLQVNQSRRPTTADLLEVPMIKQALGEEPPKNEKPPAVDQREDELRKRELAIEAREVAVLAREEEWKRVAVAHEERLKATLERQEEELKRKYAQLEHQLMSALRAKEESLLKREAELIENRTLLQQAIEKQRHVPHTVNHTYRRGLEERTTASNKENVFTSAFGNLGVLGRRKSIKGVSTPISSLPTPPISAPGSAGTNHPTGSAEKIRADVRHTGGPLLRRAQSERDWRVNHHGEMDDIVKGLEQFALSSPMRPKTTGPDDMSIMMHLSP